MTPAFGVFIGLALGLLAGGRLENFVEVRLRWMPALILAAIGRVTLELLLGTGEVPQDVRVWLVLVIYVFLAGMLLANRHLPGMSAAAIGTLSNGVAIMANHGRMPVWKPAMEAAGFDPARFHSHFYTLLPDPVDANFLAHFGPLGDIIAVPLPVVDSVVSIGDVLLGVGLAFFVFAIMVRAPGVVLVKRMEIFAADSAAAEAAWRLPLRPKQGPYVRLATNPAFSAMWLAQVISSLGDRIHQIALVFLVAHVTGSSPFALGLAFAAMTVPSFAVGPLAGALVDRWDRKRTMVGSDLARAALVAAIPAAANVHVSLVFGLVLLIAVCSTFFRPARTAALPAVVPHRDLLAANSAMWVADTGSDLLGYGLGGLFVAFLGEALSLAFFLDSVTYIVSAALVAAIVIPRAVPPKKRASIRADMAAGWHFLRKETVLFATTIQAAIAEYGLGALTALSPLLVAALPLGNVDAPTAYGFFEMSMGIGLVAGGIVIGAVSDRLPKGPVIVAGFTAIGVALVFFALTRNLALALILAGLVGLANVSFVVPSQTIFQQRTPDEMLGRVVAIRLAAVNAVLAAAMATSGLLAELFGVHAVLGACGLLTAAVGLAGLAVKSIRTA
jgi:DHA3 family macrolide efflux protein-like MFS transporter